MALLHMDGMDGYTIGSDMSRGGWDVYDGGSEVSIGLTGGRYGKGACLLEQGGNIRHAVSIAASELIFEAWVKVVDVSTAAPDTLFRLLNNSDADSVAEIKLNSNGSVSSYDSTGSLMSTSLTGIILDDTWHHFGVRCIAGNPGYFYCKIDGVMQLSDGSVDLSVSATDIDTVRLYSGSTTEGTWWDDIVFIDDSGAFNDWLSPHKIETVSVASDDSQADWTPSSGPDGYAMLDDTIPGVDDGDSSYIWADSVGQKSLFNLVPLVTTPTQIYGIAVGATSKKTDSGTRDLRPYVDSNGTVDYGSSVGLSTSYLHTREIYETDPDTATAWTVSGVDSLKIGVDVTS